MIRTTPSWAIACLLLAAGSFPMMAASLELTAQETGLREADLTFEAEGETLHGTLIVPVGDGPHPGVVLLGGSGPETRAQNRPLAEAFARSGIAAFIYDKRTRRYSPDPTGERSYALLADDAVAAVERLQMVEGLDADHLGVWGVSEGGWVAPLAANRSDAIAFVVTMSGIGIAPAAQVAWSVGRALEHRGIQARSLHRVLTERLPRFVVSAEMMGEATHDPVPVIEALKQPYLALWGDKDTVQPSSESARIIADALRRGGNRSHTLVVLSDTDHNGYPTEDGYTRTSSSFTPGYVETMVNWIGRVAEGPPPGISIDSIPMHSVPAPDVLEPGGYDHWYVQLASMGLFVIGFLGYAMVGGWRWTRARILRRGMAQPSSAAATRARRYARVIAAGGTLLWVYAFYYLFSIFIDSTAIGSRDVASIIVGGRPAIWLLLQAASVGLGVCGVLLAIEVWRGRRQIARFETARLAVVLLATLGFIPWAIHWQLLVP